jgi:AcrR family transcriptional regulator
LDAKHHIINAAITLFAQKGYAATSIREIASRASVNVAMVNYYFRSKECLFINIMKQGAGTIVEETESLMLKDIAPLDKLDSIIDLYMQYLFSNRELAIIFFQEQMNGNNTVVSDFVRKLNHWNEKVFEKIIKDGQKRKLLSDSVSPSLLCATLLGTGQQVLAQNLCKRLEPDKQKKQRLIRYLKSISRRILLN